MASPRHLAFPLTLLASGALATVVQDGDEDVANNIAVILSWPVGTRRSDPSFGIPDEAFESPGPHLDEIRDAIAYAEPRAADVAFASDNSLEALLVSLQVQFTGKAS